MLKHRGLDAKINTSKWFHRRRVPPDHPDQDKL